MPTHPNLDNYRDDVAVALAALEQLGRIPCSAAHAVAGHFRDLGISTPVAVMPLSDEEKLEYQRAALVEMLELIDAADRKLTQPEIYHRLAPLVDPLFRLLVSARAEEFNAEGLDSGDAEASLQDIIEMSCGMTIDELRERISVDEKARNVVSQVLLPGITGMSFEQLCEIAEHNDEIRSVLDQLGLHGRY